MAYVVLWLVCGFISAVIASNKGRSGGGWFLIGVLLGPLGIILALVVSKEQESVLRRADPRRSDQVPVLRGVRRIMFAL